ncbi:YhcN/YlaJ family sporulation lipoprotein [Alteribacter natronophilus]|uniref:YhcN/YlaJ family sporulation lipoprotein n=1 Tax=Alteribacter natronophilus TaxID=2583810 RepID=UPI001486ED6C|nr:YhcN/YlaJ family sporulation lipoprotein [Alteribacter natronophilus]
MKLRVALTLLLIIAALSALGACGKTDDAGGQNKQQATASYIEAQSDVSQKEADTVKRRLVRMKEVKEVRGASVDNDIYMALTVEGFDRFFLDRIRKAAHDRAAEKYPDANIHVSTDRKISSDLKKLETELSGNKLNRKELKKRLKKIEDDMRG